MPLFILQACRTPLGALGGSLKGFTAPELAGAALRGLLAGRDADQVEACLLGQAIQAGSGANPARTAARLGGLPPSSFALTLGQGHASGLAAVLLAAQGGTDLAVAGGMESSSSAPYLLPAARWGTRMGSVPVLDALLQDALWPRREEGFREADRQKALAAREAGLFAREIAGSGQDDLPPPSGEVLPADGAALVLLGSERQAQRHRPMARIVAWAQGPSEIAAADRALARAGLSWSALARVETDAPDTALPGIRSNALGGALSFGLAQGAEGARKVVTLAHQLHSGNLRYGLASLEADGLGLAIILENL